MEHIARQDGQEQDFPLVEMEASRVRNGLRSVQGMSHSN
jgi:hypothetical protein